MNRARFAAELLLCGLPLLLLFGSPGSDEPVLEAPPEPFCTVHVDAPDMHLCSYRDGKVRLWLSDGEVTPTIDDEGFYHFPCFEFRCKRIECSMLLWTEPTTEGTTDAQQEAAG